MNQNLTNIPFNLPGAVYRAPMPFGPFDHGVSTLNEMINANVKSVFTLVEGFEWQDYANCDLPGCYRKAEIKMIHFPVEDFSVPQDQRAFLDVVREGLDLMQSGQTIAVHCLAGIGRTGTFLAVMARLHYGWDGKKAIQWVRQYIPSALENEQQVAFLKNLKI